MQVADALKLKLKHQRLETRPLPQLARLGLELEARDQPCSKAKV